MIDFAVLKSTLKRPQILLCIVAALVVVFIWALAYFLPQGSKVSALQAQEATLQKKVQMGDATVARLKHTFQHSAQLKTMQDKLNSAVPSNTDAYDYVQSLSAAATGSGVHLTSISISPAPGTSGTRAAVPSSSLSETPVTLTVKGTYDELLSMISKIYQLPRLTDIEQVNISGGGAKTTRSTVLSGNFSLIAFSVST